MMRYNSKLEFRCFCMGCIVIMLFDQYNIEAIKVAKVSTLILPASLPCSISSIAAIVFALGISLFKALDIIYFSYNRF